MMNDEKTQTSEEKSKGQAQPRTWKAVLILAAWFIFSCFLSQLSPTLSGSNTAIVLWFGLLLVGLGVYRKVPFLRNGFILLLLVPLIILVYSWALLRSISR
jgi:hypothetical protein